MAASGIGRCRECGDCRYFSGCRKKRSRTEPATDGPARQCHTNATRWLENMTGSLPSRRKRAALVFMLRLFLLFLPVFFSFNFSPSSSFSLSLSLSLSFPLFQPALFRCRHHSTLLSFSTSWEMTCPLVSMADGREFICFVEAFFRRVSLRFICPTTDSIVSRFKIEDFVYCASVFYCVLFLFSYEAVVISFGRVCSVNLVSDSWEWRTHSLAFAALISLYGRRSSIHFSNK